MSGARIVDADGLPIRLGPLLGRGGEGVVHAVTERPSAVKLYVQPDGAREAKVRSMIEAGLAGSCPGVAFPTGLAFDERGAFVGFTMPAVVGHRPIHEMYSPSSRRRHHPGITWRHLVRTAANVARLLTRVHAAGAVVGDLNASGILASSRALVAMIDADSFQWGEHACRVGVQEYTPPELQGRSLDGVLRTTEHDAFGLAVVAFQLLFLGRHPHAGVPKGRDIALGEAIGQSLFAYTRVRPVRLSPPKATLNLDDLPLGLATLFERAFAPPGDGRPTPSEWIAGLERLEAGLTICTRNEAHDRSVESPCAWCRIERESRSATFGILRAPTRAVPAPTSASLATAIRDVLARARIGSGEAVQPVRTSPGVAPPAKPLDITPEAVLRRYRLARDEYHRALDAWRVRIGAWAAARQADALAAQAVKAEAYVASERARLGEAVRAVREHAVVSRLVDRQVAEAKIPGIGRRRIALLRLHGISTAADVTPTSLRKVPGLGEQASTRLLIWRNGLYAAVHGSTSPDEARMASVRERVRRETAVETARLDGTTRDMIRALVRRLDDVAAAASLPDRDLDVAAAVLAAAEEQVRIRKLQPYVALAAGPKIKSRKKSGKKAGKGPACPRCGGPMVRRWAQAGSAAQARRFGCAAYPRCGGSLP